MNFPASGGVMESHDGRVRPHPQLEAQGRLAPVSRPRRWHLHQRSRPGRGRLRISAYRRGLADAELLLAPDLPSRHAAERHRDPPRATAPASLRHTAGLRGRMGDRTQASGLYPVTDAAMALEWEAG